MIMSNRYLKEWEKVCKAKVIGLVGHKKRFDGGSAHPMGHAPRWVTSQGVNVALLHAAHSVTVCQDFRDCEESDYVPVVKRYGRRRLWLVRKRKVVA